MKELDTSSKFPIPDRDAPKPLSRSVINRLRAVPAFMRFSDEYWERLKVTRPNLYDFINSASHEIAPSDPLLRGEVAAALAGVVVLMAEVESLAEFEARLASSIVATEVLFIGELPSSEQVILQPPAA